jgi:hypothetical protein
MKALAIGVIKGSYVFNIAEKLKIIKDLTGIEPI